MVPVSRTIGADRVVDEMVVSFTHDREIDWMLPGIAPTGRRVEVPLVAVVGFRGSKLYHEHIYWDQASVLVQIGLLDPNGLPVAGVRDRAQTPRRNPALERLDETLGRKRCWRFLKQASCASEQRLRRAVRNGISGAESLRPRRRISTEIPKWQRYPTNIST